MTQSQTTVWTWAFADPRHLEHVFGQNWLCIIELDPKAVEDLCRRIEKRGGIHAVYAAEVRHAVQPWATLELELAARMDDAKLAAYWLTLNRTILETTDPEDRSRLFFARDQIVLQLLNERDISPLGNPWPFDADYVTEGGQEGLR